MSRFILLPWRNRILLSSINLGEYLPASVNSSAVRLLITSIPSLANSLVILFITSCVDKVLARTNEASLNLVDKFILARE